MESLLDSLKESPAAPRLWRFDLTPAGQHPRPLSRRLSDAIAYAESHGLTVATCRIDLTDRDCTVPEELAVRSFLKVAGRRCGLRAAWPQDDPESGFDTENAAGAILTQGRAVQSVLHTENREGQDDER